MREIEFLPDWYRQTRRRRRLLLLQCAVTAALAVVAAIWTCLVLRSDVRGSVALADMGQELTQSMNRMKQRDELQTLRGELKERKKVDEQLGVDVPLSRVLGLIDRAMPGVIGVTQIDIDTTTRPRPADKLAALAVKKPGGEVPADRVMSVSVRGVAPSNVEVANFMEALSRTGLFEQVRMGYARDRIDSGHVMCEFAVDVSLVLVTGED